MTATVFAPLLHFLHLPTPIGPKLPKLDFAGSIPVSRSIFPQLLNCLRIGRLPRSGSSLMVALGLRFMQILRYGGLEIEVHTFTSECSTKGRLLDHREHLRIDSDQP
jgi:hypothetical protein